MTFARVKILLASAIALAAMPFVRAVGSTWNSTAANGSMSTGSNWSSGTAPASSGASLSFSTSTTTTLTNDYSSLSVAGLTFSGNSSFVIGGNAITLAGTISQINTATAKTINADLILAANESISTSSGATLVVGGVISGGYKLTKINAGTLQLSGANTYGGGTQINNGTVQLVGSGTLGSTSGDLSFINTSGSLDLNGTSQGVGNLSSSGNIFNHASGTASTLTIGNGNATGGSFSGAIADHTSGTGTVALIKTGTGAITFSGVNTYTGGTAINAGTLTLGSSTALAGATGTLAVNGGTLSTTVSAATIGGDLTFSNGSMSLNGTSGGTITLASGKTFTMSAGTLNLTLGTSFDQIVSAGAGSLSFTGGTISFDTTGVGFSYASSYQIFSGFGGTSFSSLSLTGYNTSGYSAAISDAGLFSFSASAIPEPPTYAAWLGAIALGLVTWRRRRAYGAAPAGLNAVAK